jgi:hypothetical protein
MPQATTIIDLLNKGTEANYADMFRRGNLICLPSEGCLIISGDLHGHQRNFERIVTFANLTDNPNRHIVLQEIIHGGPEDPEGGCLSYKLLFDAVRYKLKFPDRVHFIVGNHAAAFISSSDIMKDGKEMNRALSQALEREYQQDSKNIQQAMRKFLSSQPLAVRCDNRIWLSHSLPSDYLADKFDSQIFQRQLNIGDYKKPGSVYILTWGRKHGQDLLDRMAILFDVDIFILGHQPQEKGWRKAGKNLIIIASDHNHGCLLPVDLTKRHTIDELIDTIVPLATIP